VTYGYDRLGRQNSITCNGMTDAQAYNLGNALLNESFSGGVLGGLIVSNQYDNLLRRTNVAVLSSPANVLAATTYGYDAASRLQTVNDGSNNVAGYSYLANSPLVGQIGFTNGSVGRMATTKQYDFLNRLTAIASQSTVAYTQPQAFNYAYNAANQRTQDTLADGSYWVNRPAFHFTSRGKGQQFDYLFDNIGNRLQTMAGGDVNGANLRVAHYTNSALNQVVGRDIPPYADIMGASILTNTVTVNGQTAYRNQEYYRQQLAVTNSPGAVWLSVTNAAPNETTVTGRVFVAQSPEYFWHDYDGNLTNDGRWTYTWDAENRLVKLAARTATGPQISLKLDYDWRGRRIRKRVWSNTGWTGNPTNDVTFLYDGWNPMVQLNAANNSVLQSYVWGVDLSGSMQGAGGVGGLLFLADWPSSIGYNAVAFDGNGNVMALVSMSGGTNCATYEYGPFGEVIRATGPMAKANPFRFSTEHYDDESDIVWYLYRPYSPSTGRFLSRDPIEEIAFKRKMLKHLQLSGKYCNPFERQSSKIKRSTGKADSVKRKSIKRFASRPIAGFCSPGSSPTSSPILV